MRKQLEQLQAENTALRKSEAIRLAKMESARRFFEENDISDAENQMKFIRQARLRAVAPVNKEAVRVLYALENWIRASGSGWRVAFEVSMGAFIRTAFDQKDEMQKAAFSSYNSKRVDFLLIDKKGAPRLVVEYHGSGHDLSDDASARMEVKRLALERAGIPLVEIPAGMQRADILSMVEQALPLGLAPAG